MSKYIPEIGEECLVTPHNTQWGFLGTHTQKGTVIAHNCDSFCFQSAKDGPLRVSRFDKVDFKPLVKPEVEKILNVICEEEGLSNKDLAQKLYDYGCRLLDSPIDI